MIYCLNHEFTMLEQSEGLMQNLSVNTPIEIVTSEKHPQKDSGVMLMPLEKLKFAANCDERVFARCTKLDGTIANLSVVSLKTPVQCDCGGGMGVGAVVYSHVVMPGHIKADGSLLKRADYPRLFKFANGFNLLLPEAEWAQDMHGMYGMGDGVETFRVPDLRGQFLRSLDCGAGIDEDRVLGSRQGDAIRNITGEVNAAAFGFGTGPTPQNGGTDARTTGAFRAKHYEGDYLSTSGTNSLWTATFDASLVVPTAGENRPQNIALIAQIKY